MIVTLENLTKWIDELAGDIELLKKRKSGGGDTVTITSTLETGSKIADYSIGDTTGSLYAPTPFIPKDYSTTEQDTGLKWFDGRPVYCKVIRIGEMPNSTAKSVLHNIESFDFFIELHGVALTSDHTCLPIPYAPPAPTQNNLSVYVTSTDVTVSCGIDYRNYSDGYVILYYLKNPPVETKKGGRKK